MLALVLPSPKTVLGIPMPAQYPANRRGHGGHRVRGPHAPPAAPSFTMGKLPRRGARAMDTDTPPDPRGVPFNVALETLTDPALVSAFREAEAAPLDSLPSTVISTLWRPPKTIILTDAQRRNRHVRPKLDALVSDLHQKLRGGSLACAGREKGAGAGPLVSFAPTDWARVGTLRASDELSASAKINGRTYVSLAFWRVMQVPPAEGWTVMEAAAALLPGAMAAVAEGGEAHERWLEASGRNDVFRTPLPPPSEGPEALAKARRSEGFFWISCDLVGAVCARTDMTFSGLDPSRPIDAPRVVLPREVLGLAGNRSSAPYRIDLDVAEDWDFGLGTAELVVSPRASTDAPAPPELRLVAVRVQLSQILIRPATGQSPASGASRSLESPADQAQTRRHRGPRNPQRDADILALMRSKIADGVARQTAAKEAHRELRHENASDADVKRYNRALKAGQGSADK